MGRRESNPLGSYNGWENGVTRHPLAHYTKPPHLIDEVMAAMGLTPVPPGSVERAAPITIVTATNYSSLTVADIDDDPDKPDGLWGTWDGDGNTQALVDMAVPAGVPVEGAGLQEIRILARKSLAGGNNCSFTFQIRQGGSFVTAMTGGTVTSGTGQVFSGTWDWAAIDPEGGNVQVRVSQVTGVGNGLELGAVEWNARTT